MDAICDMSHGVSLLACSRNVRLPAGRATVIRGPPPWLKNWRGLPSRLRVSGDAVEGGGVEATQSSSLGDLPAGTEELLQHLGIGGNGLGKEIGGRPQAAQDTVVGELGYGVQPGYVGLFIRLLGADNSPQDREEAVQALRRHASKGVENVEEIVSYPGCLNLVVNLLPSENCETAEAAARLLRHVSEVNAFRSLVAECGAVEEIAGLLTRRAVSHEVREQALCVLWNVSVEEKWRNKVANLDLVPVLLSLLDSARELEREAASGVLSNLALSAENRDILVKCGSIEKFSSLLQKDLSETSKITRQEARNLLLELAQKPDWRTAIIEQGMVPVPLVGASAYASFKPLLGVTPTVPKSVKVEESAEQETVFGAGKLLLGLKIRNDGHDIDEATKSAREGIVRQQFLARIGVLEKEKAGKLKQEPSTSARRFTFMPWWDGLPRLILILGLEDVRVSQRAAECIADIAINEESREALHKAGAVPHLVRMLGCGDESATEAAVAALDKLAISPTLRKSIAAHGAVDALVAILKAKSSSTSLNEKVIGALAHLSSIRGSEADSTVDAGAIPGLMEIVRSHDATVEVKEEVEEVLEEMSARKGDVRSKIIAAGGISPLVTFLSSGTPAQAEKAASVLENLVVDEDNAVAIVNSGIEQALKASLEVNLHTDAIETTRNRRFSTIQDGWVVARAASRLLARLVMHRSVRSLLNVADLTGALVVLLRSPAPLYLKDWVGACLCRLDGPEANYRQQIMCHQAIPALIVQLLDGISPEREEAAAVGLQQLQSQGDEVYTTAIASCGGISLLVRLLEKGTPRGKEAALRLLHALGQDVENHPAIISAGAVPVLTRFGRLELPGWQLAVDLLRTLPT